MRRHAGRLTPYGRAGDANMPTACSTERMILADDYV